MKSQQKTESDSGSRRIACLEHLSLAVEAANNLKTQDILLPVGVAREILSFVSSTPPIHASPHVVVERSTS